MALTLAEIRSLFDRRGGEQYSGEPVTQLQHALQTAQRAEEAGADDALVTAALLHDLGHLLREIGQTPTLRGVDDLHQFVALPFLRGTFPDPVLDAIGLHVDAKRYLCQAQPGYREQLSADSQRSLALQGGVFDAGEAAAFIARPGAAQAVRLRLWDDLAKLADLPTPPLEHYLRRAACCSLRE
jgi:phosphonate degradation associated HDIG domain protein